MINGIAIRAAAGLGLNMRNESPRTPDALKEIRYRVWWSLYVLEHQLGNMTGRPNFNIRRDLHNPTTCASR